MLLKDCFLASSKLLAKGFRFGPKHAVDPLAEIQGPPYKLHLHAFTHPIMQRKNCALRAGNIKMESTQKMLLYSTIIYFVALSKSWEGVRESGG